MTNTASACLGCEGRCCTTYIVPVTGYDVWRIVQDQRLPPTLFVQREPEDHPTDTSFLLRPNGSTYGLSLQHHRATHNTRVCVFLIHMRDGVRRCGIYPQRPLTCRTYPIQLQHDQIVTRNDKLCPHGSWADLNDHQGPWRALVHQQSSEWGLYAQVVQAWNARVRVQPADSGFVLDQFLDYLLNAYDYLNHVLSDQNPEQIAAETGRELAGLAAACIAGT